MYNGIVNVYKEKGFTSFDVVAKLRGIFGQRRIGHTGTLDPDAEGVLPVCLGNATRVCEYLTDRVKTYRAVMRFGLRTDTQDIGGEILTRQSFDSQADEVREAVFSFIGDYMQLPPMYSAKKVNGKRLYELARKGISVERKPCPVKIYNIKILEERLSGSEPEISIEVECSKGTYIRTLCSDIGDKLGCGAVMTELLRIRSGSFYMEASYRIDDLEKLKAEDRLAEAVEGTDRVFEAYEAVTVRAEGMRYLLNGNTLSKELVLAFPKEGKYRIYDEKGQFYALYERREGESFLRPDKMFLP